ncbi:MAG: Ig-like domain-containing protein [Acidimicrobiales bacterium]
MSSDRNLRVGVRRTLIRYLALGAMVASGLTFGVATVAGALTTPTSNIVSDNSPTTLGGSIVFTATVTGTGGVSPTGTVVFTVTGGAGVTACTSSNTTLAGSGGTATATCTITAATAGTYVVSDAYSGDSTYSALTSATDTVTVAKATPTNVVTNNSVTALGGSIVFTATVTGPTNGATPSGTVAFTVTGSANVTACTSSSAVLAGSTNVATATCTITAATAGTYVVSDAFTSDSNYTSVTSATNTVTVAKATPTNVVTNNSVTALGGSIVFTATVSGPTNGAAPSGTVVFTVTGSAGITACTSSSATLVGSTHVGTATCTITATAAGTYVVSDAFTSDSNYASVTSATNTDTVAMVTPTNVVTDNGVTTVGSGIVFTATVTGSGGVTPTGTVVFTVTGSAGVTACTSSSATLVGSTSVATATCSITASAAGTYVVSDVYPGDGNYNTVTSVTDTVTASAAPSGGGGTPPTTNAPPPSGIAASSYGIPVSGSVSSSAPLNVTLTSGSSTDAVSVPSGALPAGTVVSVYPITTTSALLPLIPSGQTYLASVAVTWELSGTSPAATSPVTLTITDPSIAVGDTVYELNSAGALASVGTATTSGSVTVTFSSDPVFVITSATAKVTPPPVVTAHAIRVVGLAVGGRTVTVTILGVGFYGRPEIISSTGHVTTALVSHDNGTQLSVRVTVKLGTAKGVHTFKITLANGKSFDVRYSQR